MSNQNFTMGKNTTDYSGQPILGQLLSFIPKEIFQECVMTNLSDKYYKKVKTWDQFVFMFYAILTGSSTIREVLKNFTLFGDGLRQCGLLTIPKRSSISDANRRRDSQVFGALYLQLYRHYQSYLSDSFVKLPINGEIDPSMVEIFDSTTVSLFSDVFKNCGRIPDSGRKKGGIKAFTKITLSERVPNFICLKSAVTNEKLFLSELDLPVGTIAVFDKGFHKFSQYKTWNQQKIGYVTRLNDNAKFTITGQRPIENQAEDGVIMDADIELSYYCPVNKQQEAVQARMVAFVDPTSGSKLAFLSNLFQVKAATICLLYKNRWTIEPLFKQIKQNFELTYFLSDSQQGIKTQIWIAMILNLIFTVIHKMIKESEDFSTMVKVAAKNTGSYISYIKFLKHPTLFFNNLLVDIKNVQLDMFSNKEGGILTLSG